MAMSRPSDCPSHVLCFLDSLESTLRDNVQVDSERRRKMTRIGQILSQSIPGNQKAYELIERISTSLKNILRKYGIKTPLARGKLWTEFHCYRQGELIEVWSEFGDVICEEIDPILSQSTTERLFLDFIKETSDQPPSTPVPLRELSQTEECAVMYCGGFVVSRLTKKYMHKDTDEHLSFVETLQSMCTGDAHDEESEHFKDYVKKWIEDVNRGGLRILQEQSFEFFKLLERIIYSMILEQQSGTNSISPDAIVLYSLNNIDLQFLWCNLAIDLKTEEKSNELLRDIIVLWIKIRGHSYAAALVEQYKTVTGQQTKGKKGIRKALQFT